MVCKVPDKPRLSIRNKTNQKILFYVCMNVDIQHTFTIYYKYKDVILSIKYKKYLFSIYTHTFSCKYNDLDVNYFLKYFK